MAKLDTDDKVALSITGAVLLFFLLFWGTIGLVVFHFIAKFW
jgi:hypothetical protein